MLPVVLIGTSSVLFAVFAYLWPLIKKKLTRIKNRAIGNYVGQTVAKLFMKENGVMQVGEFKQTADGASIKHFKNAVKTLGEWYAMTKKYADWEFLIYTGTKDGSEIRWTFGETMARAEELRESGLKARFGVCKGDRVSILMSNIPEYAVSFMAITQMGAIAVTLNAFWEGEEIEYGLTDSGSTLLIADERRLLRLLPDGRLEKLMKNGLRVCVVRPSPQVLKIVPGIVDFEEVSNTLRKPPTFDFDPTVDPESDAYIMYTSGTTTPRPKGVVQTHISIVQTAMSFQLFVEVMKTLRGEQKKRRVDLVTGPMFHASALCAVFLLSFHDGHKLVMIPRWDAESALKICIAESVTFFGAMSTMLSDILACKFFWDNIEHFSFTNIGTGGAATPSELILRTASVLPKVTQGSGWGLTETNAIGTIIGGPDYLEFPNSCGKPHPIVSLKLIDPDTLQDIAGPNQPGELCIRSVTNMRGYWNNPDETKKTLLPGNWIRSGDLGRVDSEGFVYIIDRVKEIVIRGGENISTSEVEETLYSFASSQGSNPGAILEACAFGLPHDRLGEQLAAAIVTFPGKSVDVDELRQYCERKLAKFKVPSLFFVRTVMLPRGGTGKILKRKLKEEYGSHVVVSPV